MRQLVHWDFMVKIVIKFVDAKTTPLAIQTLAIVSAHQVGLEQIALNPVSMVSMELVAKRNVPA